MKDAKKQLSALLDFLESDYEKHRPKIEPKFPYHKETHAIDLPQDINEQLRALVNEGKVPEAVKTVAHLTGAGLRVSKDYVDQLCHRYLHQ